jgi:vacuolar-type H+-ATPase subunit E/Vma4
MKKSTAIKTVVGLGMMTIGMTQMIKAVKNKIRIKSAEKTMNIEIEKLNKLIEEENEWLEELDEYKNFEKASNGIRGFYGKYGVEIPMDLNKNRIRTLISIINGVNGVHTSIKLKLIASEYLGGTLRFEEKLLGIDCTAQEFLNMVYNRCLHKIDMKILEDMTDDKVIFMI